ncbi:MAG: hypothetical protein HYU34_06030 [Candidatus Omnitrophica bacterium]|nr:hypothetical protein [Candidatus Omnitrophota bacterium]
MSLKIVHICFILLATALAVGFGFWGIREPGAAGRTVNFYLGLGSLGLGAGLVVYLFWFLSKMKLLSKS